MPIQKTEKQALKYFYLDNHNQKEFIVMMHTHNNILGWSTWPNKLRQTEKTVAE